MNASWKTCAILLVSLILFTGCAGSQAESTEQKPVRVHLDHSDRDRA